MQTETLIIPGKRIPLDAVLTPPEPELEAANVDTVAIGHVLDCLRITREEFRKLLSAFGTYRNDNGQERLTPYEIHKTYLTNMLNGHISMPTWRLAASVVILELVVTVRNIQYGEAEISDDDPRLRWLVRAGEELDRLSRKKELKSWLRSFRRAMFRRLQKDAKLSKTDQRLFQFYSGWLANLPEGYEDEVQAPA